jgi:CIC family chloride channel protein
MLCVVLSTVVSQLLHRESIYTKKIRRKGIEPPGEEMLDSLENVIVGDVMTKDFQNVPASLPLGELEERFKSAGQRGLLVMDEANEMLGIVTVSDLESALREGRDTATAGDIATRSVVTAYPDQSLRSALLQIGAEQVGRIPVVTRENKRVVAGVLRRHDIIGAYIRSAGKSGKG